MTVPIGSRAREEPLSETEVLFNFSWIVPNQIAGSGQIGGFDFEELDSDLSELESHGIRAIVSLTTLSLEEVTLSQRDITYLHLPIQDMHPPSMEDVRHFMEFVLARESEGRPIAVHCGAGLGRTGTLLACYLVFNGTRAEDSVQRLRELRPGSVETVEQEALVRAYSQYIGAVNAKA